VKYEIVLKDVPSSRTRVDIEELWQEEAIWALKYEVVFCRQDYDREFSRQNCLEATADLGV